jgi:hypothetical protein
VISSPMRCESGDRRRQGSTVGWQTLSTSKDLPPATTRWPRDDRFGSFEDAQRSQPFSARGEDRPRLSSDQMTPTGFEHHRKLAKDPLQILNTLRRRMPKGLLMGRLKGSHEARSARDLLPMREGLRPC